MSRTSYGPFLGLFYTLLCSMFLTVLSVIIKKMAYMSTGQLSMVSNAGIFACSFPIAVFTGQNLLGPKKYRLLLLVRGLLGAIALYLNYWALSLLPLVVAAIIFSTTPVVVMVLARIFLKESCGIMQCIALVLTILGVLLSVRLPELVQNGGLYLTVDYLTGLASAVGFVLCLAVVYVSMRKMKDVHYSVLLAHMGLVGIVGNACLTSVFSFYQLPHCGYDRVLMMLVGVFGWMGHCFKTLATQAEAVGLVSIARSSMDIVIAIVCQVIFFDKYPDVYSSSGAVIVIVAVSAIGMNKWLLSLPEDSIARRKIKFLL